MAPRRGAKKLKYVEALYDYTAQSDAEHNMSEGERLVLIKEDPGDGWAELCTGGIDAVTMRKEACVAVFLGNCLANSVQNQLD